MEETAKQTALRVIESLPDDAPYEDIMYEIYVLDKIEAGIRDFEEGRVIPHAEVMTKVERWIQSGFAERL
jgi:predicted transcriptional regulator